MITVRKASSLWLSYPPIRTRRVILALTTTSCIPLGQPLGLQHYSKQLVTPEEGSHRYLRRKICRYGTGAWLHNHDHTFRPLHPAP